MIRYPERIGIDKRPPRSSAWPWLAVGVILVGMAIALVFGLW